MTNFPENKRPLNSRKCNAQRSLWRSTAKDMCETFQDQQLREYRLDSLMMILN